MSKYQFFLKSIYANRKKFAAILTSLLLIVLFQNCGNAGSTPAAGSVVLSSSVPTTPAPTTPGVTPPPVVVPPTTGPAPLALDVQRANCNMAMGTPALNSVNIAGTATAATTAEVSSGLGSTNSGDSKTLPNFDFVVDRGITNAAQFATPEYNCNSHLSVRLRCEVVATNPANPADSPLAVTNAFDTTGNNLLTIATPKAAIDLAKDSYTNNNCETQLGLGVSNGTFRITPATNTERCVQGNFWLKLYAQSAIAGINSSTRNSAPRYFKVTVNNGCWNESRLKDPAADLERVINFGTAVAINGNWAAIVAPTDDASPTVLDVGAVYMFMFDGSNWVKKQRLVVPGALAMDTVASAVIRGDTMVIGSPYHNATGAAYFFRRSGETWNAVGAAINPPNTGASQAFGQTIAINDRYVFVGSPNFTGVLAKNGGVAIYSHDANGMTYIKSIFGASAYMAFGSSLAVDNTVLAIGAPQALGREGSAPGSVFIYDEAGGAFNLAATKTGTINAEKFGASVAVYGNHVAVGSPNFIVNAVAGFGRVSYYDVYSAVTAPKTFQGGTATDNLGQSVALSATGLYIGVPFANARAGRVDFYQYAGIAAGTLYFRNLAYNESTNSGYGYSVAASGDYVVIGARIKNDPNDNSGAAYIYKYK